LVTQITISLLYELPSHGKIFWVQPKVYDGIFDGIF
jgi:hypothetical protein